MINSLQRRLVSSCHILLPRYLSLSPLDSKTAELLISQQSPYLIGTFS